MDAAMIPLSVVIIAEALIQPKWKNKEEFYKLQSAKAMVILCLSATAALLSSEHQLYKTSVTTTFEVIHLSSTCSLAL